MISSRAEDTPMLDSRTRIAGFALASAVIAFSSTALGLAKSPAPHAKPPAGPLERQLSSNARSLLDGVRSPALKKKIMKSVAAQLSVNCDYCHVKDDFAAATSRKTTANFMFTLAQKLRTKSGAPVTCGGCHYGEPKFLGARTEKERIKQQMKKRFVEGLQTASGEAMECKVCHGEALERSFLPR
jgi:decaheme cytochrome c component MtrC/MtrF-like protein